MTIAYPFLSANERDRRWGRTRELMRRRDLSCLLVFGAKGRERYEGYLANDQIDGVVLFPMEGAPAHLTWGPHRVTRRMAANVELYRERFWIPDLRVTRFGPGIVAFAKERRLDRARIGVVGLDSWGPAEMEGIVTYRQWSHVLAELPGAEFVEVSHEFCTMMLSKSPEEVALFRFAADIGEAACQAMLDLVKPGLLDCDLYAEIQHVLHRRCATSVAPHLILSIGADDVGWGQPLWTYFGGPSRKVAAGDVVQAEIFPCYGGIETQQQMSVALGPVSATTRELAAVARECYEAGLETMKPGRTFGDVCAAMLKPLAAAGCWNLTPLVHSLSPTCFVSVIGHDIGQMPGLAAYPGAVRPPVPAGGSEIVLEPGMSFAFEPNACRANHRVNIGGTVLVTESGCEELNRIPNRMRTRD